MRTSITLEDDIYTLASMYASARQITLGKAISELIRRGERVPALSPVIHRSKNGLPMFPRTGHRVTAELVKRLDNESA